MSKFILTSGIGKPQPPTCKPSIISCIEFFVFNTFLHASRHLMLFDLSQQWISVINCKLNPVFAYVYNLRLWVLFTGVYLMISLTHSLTFGLFISQNSFRPCFWVLVGEKWLWNISLHASLQSSVFALLQQSSPPERKLLN